MAHGGDNPRGGGTGESPQVSAIQDWQLTNGQTLRIGRLPQTICYSCMGGERITETDYTFTTDSSGRFQIAGTSGQSVSIEAIAYRDYEWFT